MMGRGTRLCPDLFGPGQDKEFFRVFDYCQNLEFFGANPELKEPSAASRFPSGCSRRGSIWCADSIEKPAVKGAVGSVIARLTGEVREDALNVLQETVAGMNLDNFIVRQQRRTVEKYLRKEAWTTIDDAAREELVDEVAPLPTAKRHGTEEAKRFDLLMFSLELALLKGSKRFDTLRKQLRGDRVSAGGPDGHPGDRAQAELIEEMQTDQWWEGINVPLLELVRLRLRDLVQHIEKRSRRSSIQTLPTRSARRRARVTASGRNRFRPLQAEGASIPEGTRESHRAAQAAAR